MSINRIQILFLVIPFFVFGQNTKVVFLDKLNKEPLIGLQVFSNNGAFIDSTNFLGEIEIDLKSLQEESVKKIYAYGTNYISSDFRLDKLPNIIYLEKNDFIQLETVVVKTRGPKDYFTLKAYFRSWELIDGKLSKYGDGMIDYQVPYIDKNNYFDSGIKQYITSYRTFTVDSLKQKSKSSKKILADYYLLVYNIPRNDILKKNPKYYIVKKINATLGDIYKENKKTGFVIYDQNNNASLINIATSPDKDEVLKTTIGKITGKWTEIQQWVGEGNTRHSVYLFGSEKRKVILDRKLTTTETLYEIFIDDEIIDDDKKPVKYKSYIDKDRSFYNSNYWDEQLLKHPLPSEIKSQLTKVNENKNTY